MKILVVEDEAFVALDIQMGLEDMGVDVVGPCMSLSLCLKTIEEKEFDAAILDVDLNGEKVYEAAERIREKNIPFVFHTGRAHCENLAQRFPQVKVFVKPTPTPKIYDALQALAA